MKVRAWLLAAAVFCGMSFVAAVQAGAAMKVAVMDVQRIIASCDSGKAAKVRFERKTRELQQKFQAEEQELVALQKEIEKKSSVWNEQKKQEKIQQFQRKRRELQSRTADARFELKQLQEKELQPILKSLKGVIDAYGKKKGYSLIVDTNGGVLYFDKTIDGTDAVVKELNAAMRK